MSKNDGGSAFPLQTEYLDGVLYPAVPGMSLRDWFAGQALAGLMTYSQASGAPSIEDVQALYAKASYGYADAMLAERNKS